MSAPPVAIAAGRWAAPAFAPAPVDADERLHALDILRGLALFGMILVHFHQNMRLETRGLEDLVPWAVWVLVEQKAHGTFAFLFGVGFAILLRRLDARGASVVPIYLRRLLALAAFGVVAQVGFGFHVLFGYACWGVALLVVRRWSTRALLALALLSLCAGPVVAEALALRAWLGGVPLPPRGAGAALFQAARDAAQHGSYASLLAARWALFLQQELPHDWRALLPDRQLPLFLLGLLAVRHRVLDEPGRHRRLIGAAMALGALSWALWWIGTQWVLPRLPAMPVPGMEWPLIGGFGLVNDQWLALTYVGGVVLLLAHRPRWTARLSVLGDAGRMALTNYMIQAAALDALASGYGLGLALRPYLYLAAAVLFFALEAAFSRAWLARHRFGPLEWLWRSVTYARLQPLRREPAVLRPASA